MGFKTMKMGGDICSSLPWVPFTPTPCFITQYLDLPIKKCRKTIITQKVLVTHSSNIVHCNGHTQKTYMSRFANTFSLQNWSFSVFCQGEFRKQPKFHILLFWLGKMHWNGLSGMYLGFKACWFQCCRFQVSAISSSWKITILGDTSQNMGFKTIKMEWDICSNPPWVPFYPYTMFQNPISRPYHKNAEKP